MILVPAELQALLTGGLWHGVIVFLRVSAMVSVLPGFGERSVPMRIKVVLALAMTVIIAPAIPLVPPSSEALAIVGYALSEAVVGLALGLGVRLFVLALQTAGSIAAQSTSLAQILGGAAVEPLPAMGYVLIVAGLALAMMMGLHVHAARLLISSYDLFPVGGFPEGRALSHWGVAQISRAFSLAFMLAAPFVIASVVYNIALGVINRAMPQLMVAFVGAPVITMGGMILLLVASPVMLSAWMDALMSFFQNPVRLPR